MRKQLIAGNWKMNGILAEGQVLASDLRQKTEAEDAPACDWLICPPAQLLFPLAGILKRSKIALGAQDCHWANHGAHTGDLSAQMLADIGCSHVIVGHSERRTNHGEDDPLVRAKAEAAVLAGLVPVVCVGETQAQREAGETLGVIERQVRGSLPATGGRVVVAYEPVWAIGTGLTPTVEDVAKAHEHIFGLLEAVIGGPSAKKTPILYGGSVKPDNAAELLATAGVGGALVGGASLKAEDFWGIGRQSPAP